VNGSLECAANVLSTEQEQNIYLAMMDLSSDVVFEWDMETDTLTCSSKWQQRFGSDALTQNFGRNLEDVPQIHPDDVCVLREEVERLRKGVAYGEALVRLLGRDGHYTWNRVRATTRRDENGKLQKVLGVIIDVDSEQRTSQALLEKAEQDSLTGMLNKDAARRRVENYLAHVGADQRAALLIIDLDNFKAVNDRYGHLFGDMVLSRVAATIRRLFREKDILARIGGDEFMVFMMDIPDRELVERRCSKLIEALQQLYDRQLEDFRFSCSVGAAILPENGTAYQELFQRADRALYQAKDQGKNTYACYNSSTRPIRYVTKVSPRIDSEETQSASRGLLAGNMLEHWYETQNVTEALQATMGLLGMQMQVDRVFVIDAADLTRSVEWNQPDIPLPPPMQHLISDPDVLLQLFQKEDVFYCHDSRLLPESLEHSVGYTPIASSSSSGVPKVSRMSFRA